MQSIRQALLHTVILGPRFLPPNGSNIPGGPEGLHYMLCIRSSLRERESMGNNKETLDGPGLEMASQTLHLTTRNLGNVVKFVP